MTFKPAHAYDCAKQFTITALEHSMITACSDPKETAKNVADFFQTVFESLTGDESAQNLDA